MRKAILASALTLLASFAAALAQDYPTRPITLVVPYAAGGGNDVMARIVGEKMSKTLGQQIVSRTAGRRRRAGDAAGRQGRARRLHARDRRHRLARGQSVAAAERRLRRAQGLRADRPDRHQRHDRAGAPAVPAKSIPELIAHIKKQQGKFNYASAGVGSGIHLAAELFAYHGRRQDDPRALQGHRARAHRPHRRARLALFQFAAVGDRPRPGRQGARAGRDRD